MSLILRAAGINVGRVVILRIHISVPGRSEKNNKAWGDHKPERPASVIFGGIRLELFRGKLFLFFYTCFPLGMKLNLWRCCGMQSERQQCEQLQGEAESCENQPLTLVSQSARGSLSWQPRAFLQRQTKPLAKASADLPAPQQLPPDSRSYWKAKELPICKYFQGRCSQPFPLPPRALANSSRGFPSPWEGAC